MRTFLAELEREQLIVETAAGDSVHLPSQAIRAPSERAPFEPPVLATFSDMQELLLLDPIHEVDDAGWPVARTDGGN